MNKGNLYYNVLHICYMWQTKMDCLMKLMQCTTHMGIGLMVSHAAGFKLAVRYQQFLDRNIKQYLIMCSPGVMQV